MPVIWTHAPVATIGGKEKVLPKLLQGPTKETKGRNAHYQENTPYPPLNYSLIYTTIIP